MNFRRLSAIQVRIGITTYQDAQFVLRGKQPTKDTKAFRNGNMIRAPEPPDDRDLVPLSGFLTRSEVEVVLAPLRSSGIPTVFSHRYNPKVPKGELQILVPRKDREDSERVITAARQSSLSAAEPEPGKPRILKPGAGSLKSTSRSNRWHDYSLLS